MQALCTMSFLTRSCWNELLFFGQTLFQIISNITRNANYKLYVKHSMFCSLFRWNYTEIVPYVGLTFKHFKIIFTITSLHHCHPYCSLQTSLLQFSLIYWSPWVSINSSPAYTEQNSHTLAVVEASKPCHITPIIRSFYWLKITRTIEHKFHLLTYEVLTTTQPPHLYNLISVQRPRSTRSSTILLLLLGHQHHPR